MSTCKLCEKLSTNGINANHDSPMHTHVSKLLNARKTIQWQKLRELAESKPELLKAETTYNPADFEGL